MLTIRFIGKYWKKRPSSSSWPWKKFRNFGFTRMGLRHTGLIWPCIWLKFTSRSASFRTVFRSKKRGLELAAVQPRSQSFVLFPLGYVRDRCYANRPTVISALRKNITDIFDSLREDPGIFALVTWNFRRRLEWVVERESGHIENVII